MMKNTLFFLLVSVFILSCSPPEEDCEISGTFYLNWSIACSSCEANDEKSVNLLIDGNQIEIAEFKNGQFIQQVYTDVDIQASNSLSYQIVDESSSSILAEGEFDASPCETISIESFF